MLRLSYAVAAVFLIGCSSGHKTENCTSRKDCNDAPGGRCIAIDYAKGDSRKPTSTLPDSRYCAYPAGADCAQLYGLRWAEEAPKKYAGRCVVVSGPMLEYRPCTAQAAKAAGWPDLPILTCPEGTTCRLRRGLTGEVLQVCVDQGGRFHGPYFHQAKTSVAVAEYEQGEEKLACSARLSYRVLMCSRELPSGQDDVWAPNERVPDPIEDPAAILDLPGVKKHIEGND